MRVGLSNANRALGALCFGAVGSLPLLLIGACASPGPPRAPSLNLPEVVSSLTAERVGDQVQLHWTTPETTTDGLTVRGAMTAVICRHAILFSGQDCVTVLRIPVTPGQSQGIDQLPSTLAAGGPSVLEYHLEIRNAAGHSAGGSAAAFAAGGSAPAALEQLRVSASEEGAVLTWRAAGLQDVVELHRVASAASQATKQPVPGAKRAKATEVVLRVPPGEGALDRTAVMGESYTYTAQRIRPLIIGGHSLDIRSAFSAPATLEFRDLFPPRQIAGLEAIAGDGVVDLSWKPNTEADLAGYFIMRQETGTPVELNSVPSPGPSFEDKTAAPGHTYIYTVVAVDRAGNRSPASEPAQISVRADVP